MNAEINEEKVKIVKEWQEKAMADLESAEVILKETENYDISSFHSHQAIEKILKAELLRRGETFRFVHDLNSFYQQIFGTNDNLNMFEEVSFVNSLYPILRYPSGDKVTFEQAQRCLEIAKKIASWFKIKD